MSDTAQRRLARLAGVALATLLVCAMAAQMAAAFSVTGSGSGGAVVAPSGPAPTVAAVSPPAGTSGRGGVVALAVPATVVGSVPATTAARAAATLHGRGRIAAAAMDASSRSPSTGSNAWAAILLSAAAVLAGAVAWIAIGRRRRLTGPSLAAYCARNPADAQCGAA